MTYDCFVSADLRFESWGACRNPHHLASVICTWNYYCSLADYLASASEFAIWQLWAQAAYPSWYSGFCCFPRLSTCSESPHRGWFRDTFWPLCPRPLNRLSLSTLRAKRSRREWVEPWPFRPAPKYITCPWQSFLWTQFKRGRGAWV